METHRINKALLPLSWIYGGVIGVRNWMFNNNILKSVGFNLPVICVGNLTVGGTGKTPHVEFLLSFLKKEGKTAVLSRGYKRKSKGFYLANEKSKCSLLGDEPYQIHCKFPDVAVAVDEKRVHGIEMLLKKVEDLKFVVLDDAYQHRYVRPGMTIMLSDYSRLFTRDALLPAGRLREYRRAYRRADVIIVTKCPKDIKPIDLRLIATEINPLAMQSIFFTTYRYDEPIAVFPEATTSWTYQQIATTKTSVMLVAGIVNPQPIVDQLSKYTDQITTAFFADHYNFKQKDFVSIAQQFEAIAGEQKLLLVTEKDAARLVTHPQFPDSLRAYTYALPIRVEFLQDQENTFIQKIKEYVTENSRNR